MTEQQKTIDELTAIFPQHTKNTINNIYNNVLLNVGEENRILVLPSCIEQLLELPDNGDISDIPNEVEIHEQHSTAPELFKPLSLIDDSIKEIIITNEFNTPTLNLNPRKRKCESDEVSVGDKKNRLSGNANDEDLYSFQESLEKFESDLNSILNDTRKFKNENNTSPSSFVHNVERSNSRLHKGISTSSGEGSNKITSTFPIYSNRSPKIEIISTPSAIHSGFYGEKSTSTLSSIQGPSSAQKETTKNAPSLQQSEINERRNLNNIFKDTWEEDDYTTLFAPASGTSTITKSTLNTSAENRSLNYNINKSHKNIKNTTPFNAPKKHINSNESVTPLSSCSTSVLKKTPTNGIKDEEMGHITPTTKNDYISTLTEKKDDKSTLTERNDDLSTSTEKKDKNECDILLLRKGMTGYLENAQDQINAVIQNVDQLYLRNLIDKQEDCCFPDLVNRIVVHLLDQKDYPRQIKKQEPNVNNQNSLQISTSSASKKISSPFYFREAVILLQNKFSRISTKAIRKSLVMHKYCYKEAYRTINSSLNEISSGAKKPEQTIIGSFMKGKRAQIRLPPKLNSELLADVEALDKELKKEVEKGDHDTAIALNSKQYEEEGQAIECGCCYGDVVFEEMVQCLEGHLFCTECLHRYSQEATFGSGKAQLFCMTDGCDSSFPFSQLKKALPETIMKKYFERVQDEDLKLADLDNLVRCPHCEFAAEMADGDKVFRCQNQSCSKETCRYCQEDWEEHFGLPCKEVEKKDAKNIRTSYEEKMTQAKVRTCWKCKTIFLKSTGCNKMTCRCGSKMCYICRQPEIDYGHFCQHVRDPGEGCKKCKKCSLWTDPTEDDDRAVLELQKQAEKERNKLGEESATSSTGKNSIGPKIEVKDKVKAVKNHNHHANGGHHRNNNHGVHIHQNVDIDEYYGSSANDSETEDEDEDEVEDDRYRYRRYDRYDSDDPEDSDEDSEEESEDDY